MLVAIFGQQWNDGMWQMHPAAGFLWLSLLVMAIGSGGFGLDALENAPNRRVVFNGDTTVSRAGFNTVQPADTLTAR